MAKVSVIIPVYNVENYLKKCLDSVLGQTLRDIEIICVDDGSTDRSSEILRKYQAKDSRLHILTQKNSFAGAARNAGLCRAVGEYVIFWDSDDYFAPEALERMTQKADQHQADICVCDAQDFDAESGKKLAHSYLHKPFPEEEVFSIHTYQDYIYTFTAPVTWNKLIRRDLMVREQIRFQPLQHINDVLGTYTALSCAKRIVILPEKLIFYRANRNNSLMSTYGDKIDSVFQAYEQLMTDLKARGILDNPQILRAFHNKVLAIYLYTLRYCNTCDQARRYYRIMVEEKYPKMGLVNLPDGYIRNATVEERYRHTLRMSFDEYLYWQYQTLNVRNGELSHNSQQFKAKVKTLKGKLSSVKEELTISQQLTAIETRKKDREILSLQKQLAGKDLLLNQKDLLLNQKSVRLALNAGSLFSRQKKEAPSHPTPAVSRSSFKIGIISINLYTTVLNLACPLHAYAFQQFLLQHGWQNEILDYRPAFYPSDYDGRHPLDYQRKHPNPNSEKQQRLLKQWKDLYEEREIRYDKVMQFIKRYLIVSSEKFSADELNQRDPGCDCYISATDVLWKYEKKSGFDPGFFLSGAFLEKKPRIAYAGSRGACSYTPAQEKLFLSYIQDLDTISVRERSLLEYIQRISSIPVVQVLDPIFFHKKNFYKKLAALPPKKGYVLIALVMTSCRPLVETAVRFAESRHLEVIELSSFPENGCIPEGTNHPVLYGTGVEDWLGYIANASYVFTNSFHTTCLSILFEKQFWAGPRGGDKIDSLLEVFELSGRRVNTESAPADTLDSVIDYAPVQKILERERAHSEEFLLSAIESASVRN